MSAGLFAVDDSAATTVAAFDINSFQHEYQSETVRMTESRINANGMRGTRSQTKERFRISRQSVEGGFVLNPNQDELDEWLPRILGGAEVVDVFKLTETVPVFSLLFDRVVARYVYGSCYVNRCTISADSGGMVSWAIEVLGQTETEDTVNAFTAAIPDIDETQPPLIFSDIGASGLALAADASADECERFEIVIDNHLDPDHFMNSVTRTSSISLNRTITLALTMPNTADEIDIFTQSVGAASGILTLTNGAESLKFDFANLQPMDLETPTFTSREGKSMMQVQFQSLKSGSTNELIVTNVHAGD